MEIYWLARDLNKVPFGRHQFFAIITGNSSTAHKLFKSNQTIISRNLGRGYGLVLGAHNVTPSFQKIPAKFNRLIFKPFESADSAAAKEYFTSSPPTGHAAWENYKPAQGKRVIPKAGITGKELVRSILDAIDYYVINESSANVAYPPPWLGKNSNSWASSIMDVVPADLPKGASDFIGADAGHDVRIPPSYFQRICAPCKIQNPAYQ
ncbi:hypothetical protein SG34_021215 [Thalassomonas viridans]|uniref:Uncharacterized protein n=1 Tax=Thalassomonas viridans TaxID=137584 RepID=A0AAF0C7Z8_9GAMM|nr:hypothetical protein [Thalassomonas viridans]WDE03871.1 hypothetical protein SG34_021215 [Thalassomonas viridans]